MFSSAAFSEAPFSALAANEVTLAGSSLIEILDPTHLGAAVTLGVSSSGSLSILRSLAATPAIAVTSSAVRLDRVSLLAATPNITVTPAAPLAIAVNLRNNPFGGSTGITVRINPVGELSIAQSLASSAAISLTTNVSLLRTLYDNVAADVSLSVTSTAALANGTPLAATPTIAVASTADLFQVPNLVGTPTISLSTSAQLAKGAPLAANSACNLTTTAALGVKIDLGAPNVRLVVSNTGRLKPNADVEVSRYDQVRFNRKVFLATTSAARRLAATVSVSLTSTAALAKTTSLAATPSIAVTNTADLRRAEDLYSNVVCTLSATGALHQVPKWEQYEGVEAAISAQSPNASVRIAYVHVGAQDPGAIKATAEVVYAESRMAA